LTLRVGVVGGGLVAPAMHLHYLAAKPDRFAIAALAEPSRTVREALGARYGIPDLHADYRELLGAGGVDALVVCSPAGTHAEIVLAALDAGVHVFVEKPMCITLRDADAIVAAQDRTGLVVQVGTMKRFDRAYERMLAELPASAAQLRYVSVVVNDPEFAPFFGPGEIVRGGDVPAEVIEATVASEREQVEEAVGSGDPDVVRAFSESYLGSMIHDLNVVHGLLERMDEPLPAAVVDGAWWNDGRAVTGADPATLRALRRQIGMVFQQFNLVRRASVLDNVLAGRLGWAPALPTLFGHFPAEDRRIALECLAQVGLADFAQRRADTLSGGEQQRVAIARALAQSPAVILADEPTASLDPALTGSIMDLLKTIRARRGLTLVVSQHQLETALAYETRVVGFRQGRVVFDGPPAALSPAVASTIYGEEPRRSPQGGHP